MDLTSGHTKFAKDVRNWLVDRPVLLIALLMVLPLGMTFYAWRSASSHLEDVRAANFEALAEESERALLYRWDSYRQALLGGKGFYSGSEAIDRDEWKRFVEAADVLRNFPGINGIGVIDDVPDDDVDGYVASARTDGYPAFGIHPSDVERANYIIRYIEPLDINVEAVGLNIAFEDHRFEAANLARDSGRAAITQRILLVQDAERTPGFLLLLPIYEDDQPLATMEQRRAAFRHWVYAPVIGRNFMAGLTDSQGQTLDLRIYDGAAADPNALIFDSALDTAPRSSPALVIEKNVEVMQQDWHIVWSSTPYFESLESSNEPLLVLFAGLLFSTLFGAFLLVAMPVQRGRPAYALSMVIPLGAFTALTIGSLAFHRELVDRERSQISSATEEAATAAQNLISDNIDVSIAALGRMAGRWERLGAPDEAEWRRDAARFTNDLEGLRAVEWVNSDYRVQWVEPVAGNQSIQGVDVRFGEVRSRALTGAAERGEPTVTPPLDLVQGYLGFVSYSPINSASGFGGFVAGVHDIPALVNSSLPPGFGDNFNIDISSEGTRVYRSSPNSPPTSDWAAIEEIDLSGSNWTLEVKPTRKFISENRTFLPELVLAIGLLLAVAVGVTIAFAQRARRRSHEARAHQALLANFVKNTPAAVAMFDDKIRYLAASDRWYADYGLEGQEIIGRCHYDVFPEIREKHPHWLELHQRAIAGEIIRKEEDLFVREDGSESWLRYELHPLDTAAGTGRRGLIMFTENITERKRMETMKDEFVSTVNHELRTPLTAIQGSLALLRAKTATQLDATSERLLELSHKNCERLTRLVNDILDLEKITAGKMTFDMAPCDMEALVREVIEQNQGYAERYGVRFKVRAPEHPVWCRVDRDRFHQALANLLSNAAKFSPEGETVDVTLSRLNDGRLKVSVRDRGPGVPLAFQSKIFQKFAQADASSTRALDGTGLGLNIARSIAEAMSGELNFHSRHGDGATFFIVLPTCESPERKVA